ncbi:MAG: HesA/MoeB/ThiF family protein [Alphaproteobacteria bacterium]|nr:HesA/MoeB/ThiF family protein [Alphaproteobacteria bacterium]MDD9919063.1 HesA/MoeB/ThiF family protein [Alphaproteobacteria bacterium]
MTDRYHRQTVLPEWGPQGQLLIKKARVAVVGAGGLGSPSLLYLAGAGVGHLTIIDHDVVETSNLQRQILYRTDEVGQLKAELAQKQLLRLNPEISITIHTTQLNDDNAHQYLADHDIILDAVDNFATRHLISKTSQILKTPVVFGALQGFDAQLSVFPPQGPCYRCLYPQEPNWKPQGANRGVPGPMPGMLGALMALEAIKIVLNQQPESQQLMDIQEGYILTFDGRTGESARRKLSKQANCPLCG